MGRLLGFLFLLVLLLQACGKEATIDPPTCGNSLSSQPEVCNGIDDDCDGVVDNAPIDVEMPCGKSDVGACAYGTTQCVRGSLVCVGAIEPAKEACDDINGIDDDCDGVIDNNAAVIGMACGTDDAGACADGTLQCVSGSIVCVSTKVPVPETCNNIDDDCDGVVDNNTTDAGGACGQSSIFPCSLGSMTCQNGSLVCTGAVNPQNETCNGVDDDCDGAIDRSGNQPPADSVGPCNVPPPPPPGATSPCKAGTKVCTSGSVKCMGSIGPSAPQDTCNVDANCDGMLTNQPDLRSDVRNCGSCGKDCFAGTSHSLWTCVNGSCVFQGCEPGFPSCS